MKTHKSSPKCCSPCLNCHPWKKFWCIIACPQVNDILDKIEEDLAKEGR